MRSHNKAFGFLAALVGMVALTGSSAVAPITFQPESKLWVDGTSSVRAYSCKATTLNGTVAANAGSTTLAVADLEKAVRTVDVSIPVQGLECGNGTMNGHLRNALKAQQAPTIRFQLSQYDVAASGESTGTVKLVGTLQIAGQEKPVTIDANVSCDGNGAVRVKGSKQILMSEYGVRAPTLMMGTLKVRDQVVVNFDVVLKQS
jgi:polyisoprenoid-binding protein YceI